MATTDPHSDTPEESRSGSVAASVAELRIALVGEINRDALRAWEVTGTWRIEAIRSLAALNVAGIVGAATVIASDHETLSAWAIYSLGAFALGTVLAVFTLYVNSVGLEKEARNRDQVWRGVRNARSVDEIEQLLKPLPHSPGRGWFRLAQTCGWSSALIVFVCFAGLWATLLTPVVDGLELREHRGEPQEIFQNLDDSIPTTEDGHTPIDTP